MQDPLFQQTTQKIDSMSGGQLLSSTLHINSDLIIQFDSTNAFKSNFKKTQQKREPFQIQLGNIGSNETLSTHLDEYLKKAEQYCQLYKSSTTPSENLDNAMDYLNIDSSINGLVDSPSGSLNMLENS